MIHSNSHPKRILSLYRNYQLLFISLAFFQNLLYCSALGTPATPTTGCFLVTYFLLSINRQRNVSIIRVFHYYVLHHLSIEFQLFALCNVSLNRFASNIYFFVSMRVLIIYQENYWNLGFACMLIETLRTIKRASDSWLPQFTPDSIW